jgi:hypothetical protein
MKSDGTFYCHVGYYAAIGYTSVILWYTLVSYIVIWYIFPVLVYCIKKNLETLLFVNVGD